MFIHQYILKNSLHYPPAAFDEPMYDPNEISSVEGVLQKETWNGKTLIRETFIRNGQSSEGIDLESTQMAEIMPSQEISEMISGQVKITNVRLSYLSMQFASNLLPEDHPARILQPLWEFSGSLEDGRKVSLFVQAVEDKYLK